MVTFGPFLVYEGTKRFWYKFTLTDTLQISKSIYTRRINLLNWQEHEFPIDGQYYLYAYDPLEHFSVVFIIENNTICRVRLHQLPEIIESISSEQDRENILEQELSNIFRTDEDADEEEGLLTSFVEQMRTINDSQVRLVTSNVEQLRIINDRPSWCLEHLVMARDKYRHIDLDLFPLFDQNAANTKKINNIGNSIKDHFDSLNSQSAFECKENELDIISLNDVRDYLQPQNCYFVDSVDDVPEILNQKDMYIWFEQDSWFYKVEFLGHVLSDKADVLVISNVLIEWRNHPGVFSTVPQQISHDSHPQLLKLLSECYLKLDILEQNHIVATIQQVWPTTEEIPQRAQLDYFKALLNLNEQDNLNDIFSEHIDSSQAYLTSTIDFFAETSIRKHPFRNFEDNKKNIANFINYLLLAAIKMLGHQELLSLDSFADTIINQTSGERISALIYTGLSASQSRLFELILTFEDPVFENISFNDLLEYRLDLEGILDPVNRYRENIANIVNDALQAIVVQEEIEQIAAANRLNNCCAILIDRINNELVSRVILEAIDSQERTRLFTQVLRNGEELIGVFRNISYLEQRIILRSLKERLPGYFLNIENLINIFRNLAESEARLLISLLDNNLINLIHDFEQLYFIISCMDFNSRFDLYHFLLPDDKLLRLIRSSDNLAKILRLTTSHEGCEFIKFMQPYLKYLIVTTQALKHVLSELDETAQIELLPIIEQELSGLYKKTPDLDIFLNCLSFEAKTRFLYLIADELPGLVENKEHLLNLIKTLGDEHIKIFFILLKMQLTAFLPYVNDLLSILLSNELGNDQSVAIVAGIANDIEVLEVYRDELPKFIAVLANSLETAHHAQIDYSYFTYEKLCDRFTACWKLFLHPEAHIAYQDFVKDSPKFFVYPFFKICQVKFTPNFFLSTHQNSFWSNSPQRMITFDPEVVDWLFAVISGQKLFTRVDHDLYYGAIMQSETLKSIYQMPETQVIFNISAMLNAPNVSFEQLQIARHIVTNSLLIEQLSPGNVDFFSMEEKLEEGRGIAIEHEDINGDALIFFNNATGM